ncbi:MAG: PIG-L family deacetylase [Gemmatimonadota bacterium]|nr:MAG: PIG-L family deacetylase [Gemmatimonadota bacterium]
MMWGDSFERMMSSRGFLRLVLVSLLAVAGSFDVARGQRLQDRRGVLEAGLVIRQLDGVKRVLMIGAHPDDEDTNLLTTLARGMGVETAYLSLTRGDGGQNLIGPELGEGLGIIRTGELEAARALDGGAQFFGRAFDYGYSKSAAEAFRHWPRDGLVEDVVRIIRTYRPQVVVTVWSGTPRDGHGQHEAAGLVAIEAFDAAGDPGRYLAVGEPWQADKLYRSVRFGRETGPVQIETGTYDPLLGRSYFQLAMESRSQHRSQDMGAPQPLGRRPSGLELIRSLVADSGVDGIFAGVDTTLVGLAQELRQPAANAVGERFASYRGYLRRAEGALAVLRLDRGAPPLASAVLELQAAMALVEEEDPEGGTSLSRELSARLERAGYALRLVSSLVYDVRVDDDLVSEGDELRLDVRVWNGGRFAVNAQVPRVRTPGGGWSVEVEESGGSTAGPALVAPGDVAVWTFRVVVPSGADVSELYYLKRPRRGEMYDWEGEGDLAGDPRNPPVLSAVTEYTITVPGVASPVTLSVSAAAEFVGVDKARGEFRKPLLTLPALSVGVEPATMAWPSGLQEARTVRVLLRNEAQTGTSGSLTLQAPDGWTVVPAEQPFEFDVPGAGRAFTFSVRPGPTVGEGTHVFSAVAVTEDGRRFDRRVDVIDYQHIPRSLYFAPAQTRVSVFPVSVADGLRVGYITGSGDGGLEALRQLGINAREVGSDAVRDGDFSGFDVIVLGIRVYETRPDLAAVNDQLLEFARSGGTVVVQYNKYEYPAGGYAPFPVSMGSRPVDRVTDENSPVTFVDPESPVLTTPNRIGMADFDGWVQERGLYFLKEWDDRYTPILELTDPGEEPKRGSVVVAPVGDGLYMYAALAFFRQFAAGVPGAYRIFANLVSLTGDEWREYTETEGRP